MVNRSSSPGGRLIFGALLVVLLIIVVFQNRDTVTIKFLFFDVTGRLFWLLLGCAVVGGIAGYLLSSFRRRR